MNIANIDFLSPDTMSSILGAVFAASAVIYGASGAAIRVDNYQHNIASVSTKTAVCYIIGSALFYGIIGYKIIRYLERP